MSYVCYYHYKSHRNLWGGDFAVSNKSDLNFEFRPDDYFDVAQAVSRPYASIKGEKRRQLAKRLHESTADPDDEFDDETRRFLFSESLSEEQRFQGGQLHPQLLGGEFLSDFGDQEVEIARVILDSTTADVFSIRAEAKDGQITYRIASDYDESEMPPMRYEPTMSELPLTMGELIQLIDSVEFVGEEQLGRGLTSAMRDQNYDGHNAAELLNFVRVESEFYPELGAYYRGEARSWLAQVEQDQK